MVRFASIFLLLAIWTQLFEMDVKTAFLNGNLKEVIYMDQPIGFRSKGEENKLCHPRRSIYGLRQFLDHGTLDFMKL